MDEMSTTVWLVLALVYAVVLMVLYHKIFIVYYFRLFNGLMKEFITCFFIGLVLGFENIILSILSIVIYSF